MPKKADDQYAKLVSINNKTEELYHIVAERMGLSDSALIIIYGIYEAGRPCTQKELCKKWALNKQTANSSVKKLILQGILEMPPERNNFREKFVSFTEKGRLLAEDTAAKIMAAEHAAFDKFSAEEKAAAIAISEKQYKLIKEEFSKLVGEIK